MFGGFMNDGKTKGIKEEIKGVVDLTLGKLTGSEERELRGQVEITNGSNKKELADFKENTRERVDDSGRAVTIIDVSGLR
jgi:uncharacterized protein YjbJ (UPF0337 family)